jgi:5-methylcytosine-specific restriction endonuclease McrA
MAAKEKKKKQLKERPYNAQTMTESMFFGMIRSRLRQASRWWKPMQECKKDARRNYKGNNKRQKWEYQCKNCNGWFSEKEIDIDHIVECGSLKSFDDIGDFCKRLFIEKEGLQILCKNCHHKKTFKKEE